MIIPFKKHHPKIHAQSFVAPSANIIGRVTIGKGASIWYGAVLRGDINKIEVGAGTNIQDQCVLHVEKDRPCIVKNGVTVGHQATVHACTIEQGALIGIGARILNGAVVGRYSLVYPAWPLAQKTQPNLHPTWLETHTVRRRPRGM